MPGRVPAPAVVYALVLVADLHTHVMLPAGGVPVERFTPGATPVSGVSNNVFAPAAETFVLYGMVITPLPAAPPLTAIAPTFLVTDGAVQPLSS